jgi:hypothetical protein
MSFAGLSRFFARISMSGVLAAAFMKNDLDWKSLR